jgi:hypothetical protein
LLPFIKDGFESGDKAVHVVKPDQRLDHMRRLTAEGIDLAAAERSGQLELRINRETYLRDGRFDQDRMLEAFEEMASGNAKGEFSLSRNVCRMDWVVDGRFHVGRRRRARVARQRRLEPARRRGHLRLPSSEIQRR